MTETAPRICPNQYCEATLPAAAALASMRICPSCLKLVYYEPDGITREAMGSDTVLLTPDQVKQFKVTRRTLRDRTE
jgi:hypothetical protein